MAAQATVDESEPRMIAILEKDPEEEKPVLPLTAAILAIVTPEEQKQMLGETLFPRIQRMYPELARKITGMLLEMDNAELLHMVEDGDSLKRWVEKAVVVIQIQRTPPRMTYQHIHDRMMYHIKSLNTMGL